MKKLIYLLLLFPALLQAQETQTPGEKILAEGETRNIFTKKFYWGVSHNIYWSSIKGDDLPDQYIFKPSLGFNLRVEYYVTPFVGIGAGVGFQQRGAAVVNPDYSGGAFAHPWVYPLGNPDSTYREKLRFNTIEVPVTLLLRTPKDVIKGVRLSGAIGVILIHMSRVNNPFLDVEGGLHSVNYITSEYLRNDLGYQYSLGADINAGQTVLQVHWVVTRGGKNVYAINQGDGQQVTTGLRVSWLF